MDNLDLQEDQLHMRDEWRCARMSSGEQSVTTLGMMMLQLLCVHNLATLAKVITIVLVMTPNTFLLKCALTSTSMMKCLQSHKQCTQRVPVQRHNNYIFNVVNTINVCRC